MSSMSSPDHGAPVDYRAVFDALPNPCALLSVDLRIIDVNAAYPVVVGRTRRELLGRDLVDVLPLGAVDSTAAPACQVVSRSSTTGNSCSSGGSQGLSR